MNSPGSPAAPDDPPEKSPEAPADPPTARRVVTTDELFAGAREVWIQHGDQQYRLRITAAGKLILTK